MSVVFLYPFEKSPAPPKLKNFLENFFFQKIECFKFPFLPYIYSYKFNYIYT
jgi:hypothetical protein